MIELGASVKPAQSVMAAVAEGRLKHPLTAWHCCLEFFAVSTRLPEEFRLAPADAVRLINEEILTRFDVGQLGIGRRLEFLQSAVEERAAGGRIYDSHIAAIARETGAKVLVTDNARHFADLRQHGVRVLTSAEFSALVSRKS